MSELKNAPHLFETTVNDSPLESVERIAVDSYCCLYYQL